MNIEENFIIRIIKENINNRKIILRWKDDKIEKLLMEHGLEVAFYLSKINSKINNIDTFSNDFIANKSNQFFLIISPVLGWNQIDDAEYRNMGFENFKDIFWIKRKPEIIKLGDSVSNKIYQDDYGNYIESKSPINIKIEGYNNKIAIGANVKYNFQMLTIRNNTSIQIGDNCIISPDKFHLESNTSLLIGESCIINGLSIYINVYSSVKIGNMTTMQTGKLRTGRNQNVTIGDDCMFSWDVVILAHDGHMIWDLDKSLCINNTTGDQRESIVIGNHVWIGGETVFMPNAHVGNGSICGYRSLIKGNYSNNCIVVGNPSKMVKKNIAWSRDNISYDEDDFMKIEEPYRKYTIDY